MGGIPKDDHILKNWSLTRRSHEPKGWISASEFVAGGQEERTWRLAVANENEAKCKISKPLKLFARLSITASNALVTSNVGVTIYFLVIQHSYGKSPFIVALHGFTRYKW